jgi:hypothetical protein
MASKFEYQPLPDESSIRIIVLHPAEKHDAQVICNIEVALPGSGAYTALSYSWGMNEDGNDSKCRTITMNGRPIEVTQNLFEGLRRLRHPSLARRMWVDAVCINQNDTAERSSQVSRMAEIFARASEVAVWLGEDGLEGEGQIQAAVLHCFADDEHDHSQAKHTWPKSGHEDDSVTDFCALRKATSRKFRMGSSGGRFGSRSTSYSSMTMIATSTEDGEAHKRALQPAIRALDSLFNKRYFKRRWVIQELYHSPLGCVTLYFGSHSMPMSKFASVCGASVKDSRSLRRFIVGSNHQGAQDWKGVQHGLREVERIIRLAVDKEKTTFLEALERSSHLECSDPRDILYSMASLDPSFGIVPDYNLNTAETYTQFSTLMIRKGMWMTLLDNLCSQNTFLIRRREGFPSWVPDLRNGFVRSGYIQGLHMIDESAETSNVFDHCEAIIEGDLSLRCSFYAIGILNYGKPWPTRRNSDDKVHNAINENGFEAWRTRLMRRLRLRALPDVFELASSVPYDAGSMGDIICSPRRVYTTEEAVIVVLSPVDTHGDMFRIVQAGRGSDLKSLNGEAISELLHHSALPAGSKFDTTII